MNPPDKDLHKGLHKGLPGEILRVERFGGIAGFGGARAAIRSRGQLRLDSLPEADRRQVEKLFATRPAASASAMRDGFTWRLARGADTIEVGEELLPAAIIACVKDELV
jgi:hypothetical protein